jgi:hypothetical protein
VQRRVEPRNSQIVRARSVQFGIDVDAIGWPLDGSLSLSAFRHGFRRRAAGSIRARVSLWHPGFAQAVVHPLVRLDAGWIAALCGVVRLKCPDPVEGSER